MHFQVRTDNHIENSEALADEIRSDVEATLLPQYADQVRRVEVYLQDLNAHKKGVDTRCSVEVHLAGYQPVAVDHVAADVEGAVDGALEKMSRALEKAIGRLNDRPGRVSMSGEET